jgi:hypothetical protein
MKNIFFLLGCLAFLSPLLAQTSESMEKVYLKPKEIRIQDNQILVFSGNEWERTEALFSDSNGVYALMRKWYEPWECTYCGATNPPTNFVCWNCNR